MKTQGKQIRIETQLGKVVALQVVSHEEHYGETSRIEGRRGTRCYDLCLAELVSATNSANRQRPTALRRGDTPLCSDGVTIITLYDDGTITILTEEEEGYDSFALGGCSSSSTWESIVYALRACCRACLGQGLGYSRSPHSIVNGRFVYA